jgi:glyoxylase-like metal-dependent hydrolase (beta-lactamase superfamily II)
MEIVTVRLPASNAHLIRGRTGIVLVDAGTQGAHRKLRAALLRAGVEPRRLDAVVLTHGHADHAGGARELVGTDVPIVVGTFDAAILAAGHNPPLVSTNLTAKMIRPFVDRGFDPYVADVLVEDALDLSSFGVSAHAVVVGGHTRGSLVVVGRPGQAAVVGDLIRGGHFGGTLLPSKRLPHYFSEDTARDLDVLHDVIARYQPDRLYLGHGGPVAVEAVLETISDAK